jgi:3-hydroxyacyl-[acyl-carrier-protein] dehydratase
MVDPPISLQRIRELLPHRYPILMVDRVLEISDDTIVAEKLVSSNEPFFLGHFPDNPIMPGVLIVEAIAQAAGIWDALRQPDRTKRGMALVGIDNVRFRRPVVPGDVLRLTARFIRRRREITQFEGTATVAGERAVNAMIMAAFVNWGETS